MHWVLTVFLKIHETGKSTLGQPKNVDCGTLLHAGLQETLEDKLGVLRKRVIANDSVAQAQRALARHSIGAITAKKGLSSHGSVSGVMPDTATRVRDNQSSVGFLRLGTQNRTSQLQNRAELNALLADLTVREDTQVFIELANEENNARRLLDVTAHEDWSVWMRSSYIRREMEVVHAHSLQALNDDIVNGACAWLVSIHLRQNEP